MSTTETIRYHHVTGARGVLWRGAVAGVAGAVAFVVWCVVFYAIQGAPWQPLNLIAATVWPGAPTSGAFHPLAVVLGLGIVLVLGVVGGVGYSMLALNLGVGPAMLVPIAVALANVVWVFGQFLVWPAINSAVASHFNTLTSWFGHIIYGAVMAGVLVALRRGSTLTERPGGDPATFTHGATDKPLDKPRG